MIKKCKITRIINEPIYGVTEQPIRDGSVVDLNSGQILACLGISTVDEILPSGAVVRLDRDNYLTDNSGNTAQVTIKDEVVTPVKEEVKKEEVKVEEKKEEVKTEEPVKEESVEEIVGQDPIEEEVKVEEKTTKNNNNKKNNKK